jgi:hypothetical protein
VLFKTKTILAFLLMIFGGLITANISIAHGVTYEEQVVSLINAERQKQGLSALSNSDDLFQAASMHNNAMFNCSKIYGINPCFSHQVTQLNESTLMIRIKATGYNPQSVAENIAWGYTTPASGVNGWMGSSGHRANILGSYKDIGCNYLNALSGSYTGMYWTCDFATSFNVPAGTPTPTPTKTPTPTPTLTSVPTPTPTVQPTVTPVISPLVVPGSAAWWCKVAPNSMFCHP